MTHPSQMSAKEWRNWVDFCVKEKKIDATKLRADATQRGAEYEKAWQFAIEAGERN